MARQKIFVLSIHSWLAIAQENTKKSFQSPQIPIAIATGISIIVMAYMSKRVLPEPLTYLDLAFPPFLTIIYEAVLKKKKNARDSWICRTRYWIAAIAVATILVIARHLV